MSEATMRADEYKVEGEALVHKVKELLQEGNMRRIAIKNEGGKELIWARMGDPPTGMGSHWRYSSPGSGLHNRRRERRRVKLELRPA